MQGNGLSSVKTRKSGASITAPDRQERSGSLEPQEHCVPRNRVDLVGLRVLLVLLVPLVLPVIQEFQVSSEGYSQKLETNGLNSANYLLYKFSLLYNRLH